MNCRYSNVFVIDAEVVCGADQAIILSDVSQSFHLMNVMVSGEAGAQVVVWNGPLRAATVLVGATAETTDANCTFSARAEIKCAVTGGSVNRVQLLCRALNSKARPVQVQVV